MLKLELTHVFSRKADGSTDYINKMVEFDYSHLGEIRRDTITTEYGTTRTFVTFGRGLTLDYASHYIGDGDSTGSVAVWDPIEKRPVWFGLGYEPVHLGPNQSIEHDATLEVKAEYDAYKAEIERKAADARREAAKAQREYEIAQEAATPRPGKKLLVVKGRKVAKGTQGVCFWYGETQYGYRVGIEQQDGSKVFTAADNVEVIKGDSNG